MSRASTTAKAPPPWAMPRISCAFLRNSIRCRRDLDEGESEAAGATVKVVDHAALVTFLVIGRPWIGVVGVRADGAVAAIARRSRRSFCRHVLHVARVHQQNVKPARLKDLKTGIQCTLVDSIATVLTPTLLSQSAIL